MDNLQSAFSKLSLNELDFSRVMIFHNSKCLLHKSSKKHPEQPARIQHILQAISKLKPLQIIDVQQLTKQISQKQVETLAVELQGQRYVEFVQEMWDVSSSRSQMYINTDTYYGKYTYESAIAAAITSIQAAKEATSPPHPNTFAVVRPPGHHSGLKTQPHGFSFLNNVAITAQFLIKTKKAAKVAIIDWDAHHGQGTQTLFYKSKEVLYISLHRFDKGKFFPHIAESGSENIGQGEGKGFNINICWDLPEKTGSSERKSEETVGDSEYMYAFRKIIMPVLRQYNPDAILVSCGFDSAQGDPIGALKLTRQGYAFMAKELESLEKPLCLVLEGGYSPQALEWASQTIVTTLADRTKSSLVPSNCTFEQKCNQIGRKGIQWCLNSISPYWKCLQSV